MEVVISFLRQFTISVVTFEEFAVMRASFVLTHQLDSQFDFVSYVLDRMQVWLPAATVVHNVHCRAVHYSIRS